MQRGQSPFLADKSHLHHFLYEMKMDVKFSVTLLLAMQLAFSIIGFQVKAGEQMLTLVLFTLFIFIFFNLFDQRFIHREPKKKDKKTKK